MTDIKQILEKNEEVIEAIGDKPKPLPHYDDQYPKEVRNVVERTSIVITPVPYKNKFLEAKKEYLTDVDAKPVELAKKYRINPIELQKMMREENWDKQRLNLYVRADEKARELMESTLSEVKSRHILIGKMLQKLGQTSIRKVKPILAPKEALSYITEGVRMEREAYGMDKQSPKIVNIIAQQQKIIQKYKHGPKEKRNTQ